jgi:hypothetical protein
VLIPEPAKNPGFDIPYTVSTPHQWFACAHLLGSHLPRSYAVTFPKRSPPWLLAAAALGGLKPTPASRLRGAFPHLLHSCVRLQVEKNTHLFALVAHDAVSIVTFSEVEFRVIFSTRWLSSLVKRTSALPSLASAAGWAVLLFSALANC